MGRVGGVRCSLGGSSRTSASRYFLARLSESLPLSHLPSSEWFSVNVFTDGFASFSKICRCIATQAPTEAFLMGCSEQLSPVGMLLYKFLVGVTLCFPHGPGATRVIFLQVAACCHQLHSWNSWGCPGRERCLVGPGELNCAEPCSGGWVSWRILKYKLFISSVCRGLCYPSVIFSWNCPGGLAVRGKERECMCTHKFCL